MVWTRRLPGPGVPRPRTSGTYARSAFIVGAAGPGFDSRQLHRHPPDRPHDRTLGSTKRTRGSDDVGRDHQGSRLMLVHATCEHRRLRRSPHGGRCSTRKGPWSASRAVRGLRRPPAQRPGSWGAAGPGALQVLGRGQRPSSSRAAAVPERNARSTPSSRRSGGPSPCRSKRSPASTSGAPAVSSRRAGRSMPCVTCA